MALLYYGGGNCTIEGDVSSLIINYKGNIVIDDKLPDSYTIELERGRLIIDTSLEAKNLNELFNYLGEFIVLSATGKNLEGAKESIGIKRVMDYSELLETKAEDLTVKSENIKVTHLQGRTFRKTMLLPKKIGGNKLLR